MSTALLNGHTGWNNIAAQKGLTGMEADAFRHAAWQATLTQTFGEALAQDAGNLYETVTTITGQNPDPKDRNMDLWNNREGRNIGKEAKEQGLSDQQLYDKIAEAVRNGRLVTDSKLDPRVDPKNFDPRLIPSSITELEKLRSIKDAISDLFGAARNWIQRRDPLILDLDADGLETVGINPAAPILFDHDGDGIKTGTGWVKPDDGFLVLDRNGNGIIDSGIELFGDSTPLSTGGNAADGFAALAAEDTNLDGKVDANDARFANLRIWRDLNQDGISQSNELATLSALNIASINVAKTANSQLLANGNQIADLGTYVKTDGTVGALGETAQLGDVNLADNPFYSQFPGTLPIIPAAAALPDMQGSGMVRDLREATSLSAPLAATLSNYAVAPTRDTQVAQLDTLLKAWSDTSAMATTATGAYVGHALTVNFAGVTNGSAAYQAWLDKLSVLERFNGLTFQPVPTGSDPVTLNIGSEQMSLLNQSYASLQDSVYGALVMQTRFKPLIDSIDLVLTADGISLDFSGVVQRQAAANESVFEIENAA